jgi:hypothetical protein
MRAPTVSASSHWTFRTIYDHGRTLYGCWCSNRNRPARFESKTRVKPLKKERLWMRSNSQQVRFYVPDTEERASLGSVGDTGHDEDVAYADWNHFPRFREYADSIVDWWKARQQPSLAWPTKVIGAVIPWIWQNWLPAMFLTLLLVSVLFLHRP